MSGSSRHIACKLCRDRKVRCDGGQPRCQRCTRSGDKCVYNLPSKQQQKNVDLQQTVELLEERLSQAEAALSLHQTCATSTDTPTFTLDPHVTTSAAPFSLDTLPDMQVLDDAGPVCFDFDLLDANASHVTSSSAPELLPDELMKENVQIDLCVALPPLCPSQADMLQRQHILPPRRPFVSSRGALRLPCGTGHPARAQ